jgi:hypothetical protein
MNRKEKRYARKVLKRQESTKPKPVYPLREWVATDGEVRYGLHPLWYAVGNQYDASLQDGTLNRLINEFCTGERRLPLEVVITMLEVDEAQREAGYPDENIQGLIDLLTGEEYRKLGEAGACAIVEDSISEEIEAGRLEQYVNEDGETMLRIPVR